MNTKLEQIPTPYGMKNKVDLRIHDIVFGSDGEPITVTAVDEILYDLPCYEIVFSSGEKIIVEENHLW